MENNVHAEAVQTGMALLDSTLEEGWRNKIDVASLDLGSLENCMLGQLFGSFGQGMRSLDLTFDEMIVSGFETVTVGGYEYARLTDAWREALAA